MARCTPRRDVHVARRRARLARAGAGLTPPLPSGAHRVTWNTLAVMTMPIVAVYADTRVSARTYEAAPECGGKFVSIRVMRGNDTRKWTRWVVTRP